MVVEKNGGMIMSKRVKMFIVMTEEEREWVHNLAKRNKSAIPNATAFNRNKNTN